MDLKNMTPRELDAEMRAVLDEQAQMARESCEPIGRLLRAAPITFYEAEGRGRLRIELPEATMETLRDLCDALTGLDGYELEDDHLVGLLALAVLRGGPLRP
ncbi:MAG: hypothetical protein DRJ42_01110 [Deltaproteobacteria bacterium]|nr:MAG: hypothetical protein DRJ42_01110 [Deltaproteobacteria bacterium]